MTRYETFGPVEFKWYFSKLKMFNSKSSQNFDVIILTWLCVDILFKELPS